MIDNVLLAKIIFWCLIAALHVFGLVYYYYNGDEG